MFLYFKEYAEFQYRRRHRQRRRGDMSSLRSNTPDPDDLSDSTLGTLLYTGFLLWWLFHIVIFSFSPLSQLVICIPREFIVWSIWMQNLWVLVGLIFRLGPNAWDYNNYLVHRQCADLDTSRFAMFTKDFDCLCIKDKRSFLVKFRKFPWVVFLSLKQGSMALR